MTKPPELECGMGSYHLEYWFASYYRTECKNGGEKYTHNSHTVCAYICMSSHSCTMKLRVGVIILRNSILMLF